MEKQRQLDIDLLRGIAIILMILGHSFIAYPVDISQISWCSKVQHFIYTFHMELLFFVSGAVYHCGRYSEYIWKKVKRILVPYFVFGFGVLLLRAFAGSAVNKHESFSKGIFKLVLCGGGYWFLYTIFIIFLVYPWLDKVFNTIQKKVLLALIFVMIDLSGICHGMYLCMESVVYYMPYFILGHMYGLLSSKKKGINVLNLKTKFSVVIISFLLFLVIDINYNGLFKLLQYFRALSMIAALICFVNLIQPFINCGFVSIIKKIVVDCSVYSLQLYLFNGYLLTVIRIIICSMLHITSSIIIVGAIWVGCISITLVCCKFIIPYIPVVRSVCGIKAPS